MPFFGKSAAAIFLSLSDEERTKICSAQKTDPYGRTGDNGLHMLERIVAVHRTDHLLAKVETTATALGSAAS